MWKFLIIWRFFIHKNAIAHEYNELVLIDLAAGLGRILFTSFVPIFLVFRWFRFRNSAGDFLFLWGLKPRHEIHRNLFFFLYSYSDSRYVEMWWSEGFGADFTPIHFVTTSIDLKVLCSSQRALKQWLEQNSALKDLNELLSVVRDRLFYRHDWLSTHVLQSLHDHPRTALLLTTGAYGRSALCISTAVGLKTTDSPRHWKSKNGMDWLRAAWPTSPQDKSGRWTSRSCLSQCGGNSSCGGPSWT